MSEEIVGYLCEDCGVSFDMTVERNLSNFEDIDCICDGDVRNWRPMTKRDFYWDHNPDGFECGCDDCEKFREESK